MLDLAKRVSAVFLGRFVARGSQFATFLILTRILSPEDFGWYGLFTTAILLAAQIGSLGLRQAAAYRIGREIAPARSVFSTLLKLSPLLTLVSGCGVFFLVANRMPDMSVVFLIGVVIASMGGALITMLMQGVLLGLGRTSLFSLSDTLYAITLLLQILIFSFLYSPSLRDVFIFVSISFFVSSLFIVFCTRKVLPNEVADGHPVLPMVSHGLMFSVNLFLILLSGRISIYLVESMLSAADAGQFFAGLRLGDMLIEASMALGLILFSDTVRAKDPIATMRQNARLAAWVLWAFTIGATVLALASGQVAALLFGREYAAAGDVLAITAFMIGPAAATKVIYPPLSGCGKPIWGSPAIVASIAINVVLSVILIPRFGLAGASWALVLSQIILLFGYAHVLRRRFGIGYGETLIPKFRGARDA